MFTYILPAALLLTAASAFQPTLFSRPSSQPIAKLTSSSSSDHSTFLTNQQPSHQIQVQSSTTLHSSRNFMGLQTPGGSPGPTRELLKEDVLPQEIVAPDTPLQTQIEEEDDHQWITANNPDPQNQAGVRDHAYKFEAKPSSIEEAESENDGMVKVRFLNVPKKKKKGSSVMPMVNVNDDANEDVILFAKPGQNLLNLGDKNGITIPRACRSGLCGTCTASLADPTWEGPTTSTSTFKKVKKTDPVTGKIIQPHEWIDGTEIEGDVGGEKGIQFIRCCSTGVMFMEGAEDGEMVIDLYRNSGKTPKIGSAPAKKINPITGEEELEEKQENLNPMARFSDNWENEYVSDYQKDDKKRKAQASSNNNDDDDDPGREKKSMTRKRYVGEPTEGGARKRYVGGDTEGDKGVRRGNRRGQDVNVAPWDRLW